MLNRIWRAVRPNPLNQLLRRAKKNNHSSFLIAWNRGLGDIPLGLYAIVHQIRTYVPQASITFITRENLKDGFELLGGAATLIAPSWKRHQPINIMQTLKDLNIPAAKFNVIIEKPDPTHWVKWQRGSLTPQLNWNACWDNLYQRFKLDPQVHYIGAHVQTETQYANWRNWPDSYWEELFKRTLITHPESKFLLFGFEKQPVFDYPNVIDLRGETSLFELLSIIKNCCKAMIVLDSGVSAMTYYLNTYFPIRFISLWGDTNMGILKQNVPSPNLGLIHIPLKGAGKDIRQISPEDVERVLYA